MPTTAAEQAEALQRVRLASIPTAELATTLLRLDDELARTPTEDRVAVALRIGYLSGELARRFVPVRTARQRYLAEKPADGLSYVQTLLAALPVLVTAEGDL